MVRASGGAPPPHAHCCHCRAPCRWLRPAAAAWRAPHAQRSAWQGPAWRSCGSRPRCRAAPRSCRRPGARTRGAAAALSDRIIAAPSSMHGSAFPPCCSGHPCRACLCSPPAPHPPRTPPPPPSPLAAAAPGSALLSSSFPIRGHGRCCAAPHRSTRRMPRIHTSCITYSAVSSAQMSSQMAWKSSTAKGSCRLQRRGAGVAGSGEAAVARPYTRTAGW